MREKIFLVFLMFVSVSYAAQSPYTGSHFSIPGTIQSENFDNGGEGVAYHDFDTSNNGGQYRSTGVDIEATLDTGGGYNVGWMKAGEWLEYSVNVLATGDYTLNARVASTADGGTFHVEFDGVDKTGTMTIYNTGGWQVWQTISKTFRLDSGNYIMRVMLDSNSPNYWVGNINYISLARACTADDARDNSIVNGIDKVYCTKNEKPPGTMIGSSISTIGRVCSSPPSYWQPSDCLIQYDDSILYGEKKVFVDDVNKYNVMLRVAIDDYIDWIEINGIRLNRTDIPQACCTEYNSQFDVTNKFSTGWNTLKFKAVENCGRNSWGGCGGRLVDLDFSVRMIDTTPPVCRGSGFVFASENRLVLNGESYKFIGANVHSLAKAPDDEIHRILNYLSNTCEANVIRMWGYKDTFSIGGINNVRKVLDIGAGYNVKFIIALEDFPYGPPESNPREWFTNGYRTEYKPYVQQIVNEFRGRQEILAWEIMNEPHCKGDEACVSAFRAFVDDISKTIKSVDSNHIVSIGTMGLNHLGERISNGEYQNIHSIAEVGISSGHYNDEDATQKNYMYSDIGIAYAIGKPFYIGEIWLQGHGSAGDGSCTSSGCTNVCGTTELQNRAQRYSNEMNDMFNRGADGYLIWQYSPVGNPTLSCDRYSFFNDDPICGAMKAKSDEICSPPAITTQYGIQIDVQASEKIPSTNQFQALNPAWARYVFRPSNPSPALPSSVNKLVIFNGESASPAPHGSTDVNVWRTYVDSTYLPGLNDMLTSYPGTAAIEIWNEEDICPDIATFCPGIPAQAYAYMLKKAAAAVKAKDSSIKVIMGGLASGQASYITDVINADSLAFGQVDAVGLHPYGKSPNGWCASGCSASLPFGDLAASVNEYKNAASLPVWITEIGQGTTDRNWQADYLTRVFNVLSNNNVPVVNWYAWIDSMTGGDGLNVWGLYDDSGNIKASGTAFRAFTVGTKLYTSPEPSASNSDITVTATSDIGCTHIGVTSAGFSNCRNLQCCSNPTSDGNQYGWQWTCTASSSAGTYTAAFTGDQAGCSATRSFTVQAADTAPPATSIVSVEGDTSAPYIDNTDNSKTDIVINGEAGMACRIYDSDIAYSDSSGALCTASGTQATCTVSTANGNSYTRYIACKDSAGNGQSASQNLGVDWAVSYQCSDGTNYGQCSATKPKYCDSGSIVNKCSVCGCDSGQVCQNDNCVTQLTTLDKISVIMTKLANFAIPIKVELYNADNNALLGSAVVSFGQNSRFDVQRADFKDAGGNSITIDRTVYPRLYVLFKSPVLFGVNRFYVP